MKATGDMTLIHFSDTLSDNLCFSAVIPLRWSGRNLVIVIWFGKVGGWRIVWSTPNLLGVSENGSNYRLLTGHFSPMPNLELCLTYQLEVTIKAICLSITFAGWWWRVVHAMDSCNDTFKKPSLRLVNLVYHFSSFYIASRLNFSIVPRSPILDILKNLCAESNNALYLLLLRTL